MTDTSPEVKGLEWHFVADLLALYARGEFAAERIKGLREQRGWSTETLAKHVTEKLKEHNPAAKNVAQSTIWRIENPGKESGSSSITIDMLLAIARVFDKTIADLLLPGQALDEVEGWELYQEAANVLDEMRRLTDEYDDKMRSLRSVVARRPPFASQLRDYLERLDAKLTEMAREHAKVESRPYNDAAVAEWKASLGPTPAIRAAEDALSNEIISAAIWTHTRVTHEDLMRFAEARRGANNLK